MTKKIRPQSKRGTKAKRIGTTDVTGKNRGNSEIRRAAARAGVGRSQPASALTVVSARDENVYQHLLRELREAAADGLGGRRSATSREILQDALSQTILELEVLADLLEHEDQNSATHYFVRGIMARLQLAMMLGEGLFDPDHPFVTSSAMPYHPTKPFGFAGPKAEKGGEP